MKKYNNSIIAKRYAKALFHYANEYSESHLVYNDMKKLEYLISKFPIFYYLITNPLITNKEKIEIILKLLNFSSKISLKIVSLILNKNRELIINIVAIEYQKIYQFINKIYKIKIITSIDIDRFFQKKIINKFLFISKINYKYEIEEKIDNGIIGGFCIYIGEKKLDFTIKKIIFHIKNNFINY